MLDERMVNTLLPDYEIFGKSFLAGGDTLPKMYDINTLLNSPPSS